MSQQEKSVIDEVIQICERLDEIRKSRAVKDFSFMFISDFDKEGATEGSPIVCCNTDSIERTQHFLDVLSIYEVKQNEVGRWENIFTLKEDTFLAECVDDKRIHGIGECDWVEKGKIYRVIGVLEALNCLNFQIVDPATGVEIEPPRGFKGFASTRFIPLIEMN